MKKIILTAIIVLFSQMASAQTTKQPEVIAKHDESTGIVTFYLNEKEIARRVSAGAIVGKIPDGPVKVISDKRKDVFVYEYKNNKALMDSLKIYDPQGNLPKGLKLVDGKLTGIYRRIESNDGSFADVRYEKGLDAGSTIFSPAGVKIAEFSFDDNRKTLLGKYFYANGKLKTEIKSKTSGTGERLYEKNFDENGKLLTEK